jgi:hypothetical protein
MIELNYIEGLVFKIANIVKTALPGGHAVFPSDNVVGRKVDYLRMSAFICGLVK